MTSKSMCDTVENYPSDLLTWQLYCLYGNYPNCPVVNIKIPDNVKNKEVNFSLWCYQMSQKKGKHIISDTTWKLRIWQRSLLTRLKLRQHIFIVPHQWNSHTAAKSKPDSPSVITSMIINRILKLHILKLPCQWLIAHISNSSSVSDLY